MASSSASASNSAPNNAPPAFDDTPRRTVRVSITGDTVSYITPPHNFTDIVDDRNTWAPKRIQHSKSMRDYPPGRENKFAARRFLVVNLPKSSAPNSTSPLGLQSGLDVTTPTSFSFSCHSDMSFGSDQNSNVTTNDNHEQEEKKVEEPEEEIPSSPEANNQVAIDGVFDHITWAPRVVRHPKKPIDWSKFKCGRLVLD